jgi:hypothetical protein
MIKGFDDLRWKDQETIRYQLEKKSTAQTSR